MLEFSLLPAQPMTANDVCMQMSAEMIEMHPCMALL